MRSTPFGRAHLGIAVFVVFALFGVAIGHGTPAPTVTAVAEPRFLTWQGEPHDDDYNHFLIEVGDGAVRETWLTVDDDHLVASGSVPEQVALGEIDSAVSGELQPTGAEDVANSLAAKTGVVEVRPLPFGIYAVTGSVTAEELRSVPGVLAVVSDPGLGAATVDPYFPSQWGLDNDGQSVDPWVVAEDADIDAPEGWHRTRGDGVVVAVIDSGMDIHHPDLAANVWANPGEVCDNGLDDDDNGYADDCHGWDFANSSPDLIDHVGHGTHVAGIIAAIADNGIGIAGVAYEARVMPLKIGDGTPALSSAIEAIAYAIDNGARVINISWVLDDPSAAAFLDTAVTAARESGVLIVAAAGNEPMDLDDSPVYPAASELENVISVAASTGLDEPATWSAYGADSVDLFAPGQHIISTVPGGYGVYSGTSMAAPLVSGAAALLWAATPDAEYEEVKGALLDRSDGPNDGLTAFRGMAASDGRLNISRSIYSAPLFQPPVMFDFHNFDSFEPAATHEVAITAKTVDPWMVPPQTPTMYRAGLYVPSEGQPMAVVGHEITYVGNGAEMTAVTDGTGRSLVGLEFEPQRRSALVQGGDVTELRMSLPPGTYAFTMEIVDVADPGDPKRMGDASAVFFIVSASGAITEMPQIPVGVDPVTPAPPTTVDPAPTSAAPTSSTSPTAPPSDETTTTAAVTTTSAVETPTTIAVDTSTTGAPTSTTTTLAPSSTTTTTSSPLPPTSTTTTAPVASTTTTVASPTSTTTNPPAPPTVAPGGMRITDVDPAVGQAGRRTLVTITGRSRPNNPPVINGG